MPGIGDTSIGGSERDFPSTHWSVIQEAKDRKAPEYLKALNRLCGLYWKPVYAYIRAARGHTNEEAKDLTQEFLLDLVEGDLLARFAPERGNFRSYLRGVLHLFLLERHRASQAAKRGGGRQFVTLSSGETDLVDKLIDSGHDGADDVFEKQWANSVIDLAVDDLRRQLVAEKREDHFRLFERHQLSPPGGQPPSHAELAGEFGVSETDVNNRLAACRRRLRELVSDRVREYVSSAAELQEELARLFRR